MFFRYHGGADRLRRRSPAWNFEPDASPANFFRDSVWGKMDICVWSKLFRRSMLETHRLRFHADLKRGGEDETFRLTVLPHASRLLFIPDCLYYYRLMRRGSLSRHCDDITHAQCVQEFRRLLYIVDYWKEHGWLNAGLFAYGVRKLKPFFISKHPLFNRMTSPQKRIILAWWHEFYRQAGGDIFLSTLSERDRQLADLLNAVPPPPTASAAFCCWRVPAFLGKKEGTIPANGFFPPTFPMSLLSPGLPEISGQRPD